MDRTPLAMPSRGYSLPSSAATDELVALSLSLTVGNPFLLLGQAITTIPSHFHLNLETK